MTDSSSMYDPQRPLGDSEPPDLREFDDDYDAAKPADNDLPDGRYEVELCKAVLDRTQNGDAKIMYDMIVRTGPYARRHLFKNSVITTASLAVIKRELKVLELELSRFSELELRLGELVGRAFAITKRTKDEYANIYFNKRLPSLEIGAPADNPF